MTLRRGDKSTHLLGNLPINDDFMFERNANNGAALVVLDWQVLRTSSIGTDRSQREHEQHVKHAQRVGRKLSHNARAHAPRSSYKRLKFDGQRRQVMITLSWEKNAPTSLFRFTYSSDVQRLVLNLARTNNDWSITTELAQYRVLDIRIGYCNSCTNNSRPSSIWTPCARLLLLA